MKRILSLTLALVMVLGTFTGVFAAEQSVEEFAAEFLEKKGVLLGDDKGDLMLKDNLERRDAVVLLSRLLGVEEVAREFPTSEESPSWTDVRTDAYYVPFFAWAEANEYFEGNDNGTFAPRAEITAPEYALVLLRALGYEVNGHESWKASLETAEKIGLLKDVEVKFEDNVVRGQMAVMTFNALGTKVKGSDETLADKLGIELPVFEATELTAKVNDTENLAEVVVELSNAKLADEHKLENISNYKLNGGRTIKSATIVENDVVLLLNDALVKGREYTLTVRNIDRAINKDYKFEALDNTVPTVEEVTVLGEYGIKITTSEPVQLPSERDISIDGKRTSMIVRQYGRDIIITPYHERSFDKDAKELQITSIRDFAGYTSGLITEAIEIVKDEVAPEIVSSTVSGNKVTVVFDKDIYEPSVKEYKNTRNLGNASYEERRATLYAQTANKVGTNKVEYTFKDVLPKNVELTIEGVQNHSKVTMERTRISPELVAGQHALEITNNSDRLALNVDRAVYNKDAGTLGNVYNADLTLNIKFDKELKDFRVNGTDTDTITAATDLDDYFTLYEKAMTYRGEQEGKGKIVKAVVDGKTLKVTFNGIRVNNLDKDFDYILEVKNIQDRSGNVMEKDYVDFEVVPGSAKFDIVRNSDSTLQVSTTSSRYETEIRVNLTDAVDLDNAKDARNYLFSKGSTEKSLRQLGGYVDVTQDGETLIIVVPESLTDLRADYDTVEILKAVTNLDGAILQTRTFGF